MINEKMEDFIRGKFSNNNKKNVEIIGAILDKRFKKLKDNDFIRTRDAMVIGMSLAYYGIQNIDKVHTSVSGREELIKTINEFTKLLNNIVYEINCDHINREQDL